MQWGFIVVVISTAFWFLGSLAVWLWFLIKRGKDEAGVAFQIMFFGGGTPALLFPMLAASLHQRPTTGPVEALLGLVITLLMFVVFLRLVSKCLKPDDED